MSKRWLRQGNEASSTRQEREYPLPTSFDGDTPHAEVQQGHRAVRGTTFSPPARSDRLYLRSEIRAAAHARRCPKVVAVSDSILLVQPKVPFHGSVSFVNANAATGNNQRSPVPPTIIRDEPAFNDVALDEAVECELWI